MTRFKSDRQDADRLTNTFRLLTTPGVEPVVKDGQLVGLVVPDRLRDYKLPHESAIAGYMGDAEMLCVTCVQCGWADEDESAEQALTRAATQLGIDRADERNYDSRDLPKPVTFNEITKPQQCGDCLEFFGLDPEDFRRCPDEDCGDFVTGTEGPGACQNCGVEYGDKDFPHDYLGVGGDEPCEACGKYTDDELHGGPMPSEPEFPGQLAISNINDRGVFDASDCSR